VHTVVSDQLRRLLLLLVVRLVHLENVPKGEAVRGDVRFWRASKTNKGEQRGCWAAPCAARANLDEAVRGARGEALAVKVELHVVLRGGEQRWDTWASCVGHQEMREAAGHTHDEVLVRRHEFHAW